MYEFARGPLVWIAFAVFFAGAAYKLWRMFALAKKERVVFPYMDLKFAARSVAHWLVPFGSRNMRLHPGMTLATFAFHICLVVTPIFLMAHNVLWHESWGVRLPALPEHVADAMTFVVILVALFLVARRMFTPAVAYVTYWSDWVVLLIAVGPFITGFLATQGWFPYDAMLLLHIFSGALWLAAIPFTRLSHMLYFVFTRAYMGCEFGGVRNAKDW
ncbi:MAG: nitrate reductase [Phycisphaerae bacterium]|nr:nitrate reductase [Phycisphaerae bacterium]